MAESSLPDIHVLAPGDNADPVHDIDVPNRTMLFRSTCYVPLVLEHARSIIENSGQIRIGSAACSVGAEVDTAAVEIKRLFPDIGNVTIQGFDVSEIAIQKAQVGKYTLTEAWYGLSDLRPNGTTLDEATTALKKVGFGLEYVPKGWISEYVFDNSGYYIADAKNVRNGHDISFTQLDLTQETSLEANLDIVLANNILYHLQPGPATRFIRNVAKMLGGNKALLSLGSTGAIYARYKPMGRKGSTSETSYNDWLKSTTRMLMKDFDLFPIDNSVQQRPLDPISMFMRH